MERVRLLLKRARIDYTIEDQLIKADIARNECHNELKAVGLRLRKSISEVNFDIISLDENLSEYNLPEFRMMLLDDVFEPH